MVALYNLYYSRMAAISIYGFNGSGPKKLKSDRLRHILKCVDVSDVFIYNAY